MTEIKDDKPNPGSDAAIDAGCLCPVVDNQGGRGSLEREGAFWIAAGYPLHGGKQEAVQQWKS